MPDSDGPSVPISRAMSWRVIQIPQARSGGIAAVMGGIIIELTATAVRDRNDPRTGTMSVIKCSQYQMVTLVNVTFCRSAMSARRTRMAGWRT
ncbi:hypothetical protein NJB1907f44_22280 [Mycobacterium marinum]|uniref:Uncharacterized protein n=1 Tax=Mycobacterium shottsii TaxID=133549 RepID=A0A7I7LE69_9MYCO|nr:hypothetical protein MMRN_39520 [Mycobacterium marinum]BBX57900.1 hypothetical protein MSHO_32450 [Mycobacterium shottsii]GJO07740.1 hypothetical protein NJB1907E90_21480 [Mycobacterium marinum]GJO09930.1 hypothetical protein NJB1907f34b_41360 [Mycobacterium marinum]GJO12185.1 hypothetical protein NJB1808e29_49920 [Mycobacterium marinum]